MTSKSSGRLGQGTNLEGPVATGSGSGVTGTKPDPGAFHEIATKYRWRRECHYKKSWLGPSILGRLFGCPATLEKLRRDDITFFEKSQRWLRGEIENHGLDPDHLKSFLAALKGHKLIQEARVRYVVLVLALFSAVAGVFGTVLAETSTNTFAIVAAVLLVLFTADRLAIKKLAEICDELALLLEQELQGIELSRKGSTSDS